MQADPPARAPSIWTWPLVLNALVASGLVTALLSDGPGDWWAWAAIGLPVAVMGGLALRR